jgi:hypothetical protein
VTDLELPAAPAGQTDGHRSRQQSAQGHRRWAVRASYPIAAALLCVVALGPLLHPQFPWGATEAPRSVGRLEALLAGAGGPLWSGADGPLASLIAGLGVRAGLAPPDAVKVTLGLGLVAGALAMYRFAADLWGRRGGLLAAVLFAYAPVRLVDLFVRGALAESVAWALPPLALWAGRCALLAPGWRAVASGLVTALAIAGLVLTHLGVAVLSFPVMALFWALVFVAGRRRLPAGRGWRLGLLLLLAGCASGATIVLLGGVSRGEDPAAFVIYPHQLFSPRWGYGAPVSGPDDPLSFEVGVVAGALTLVAVVLSFWLREDGQPALHLSRQRRAAVAFFAVVATFSTVLTLPPAAPLWAALQSAAALELPWRLLSVAAFGLAVAGGACGLLSSGRPAGQIALATFIGVAIVAVFPYLQTPESVFRPPPSPSASVAPPR